MKFSYRPYFQMKLKRSDDNKISGPGKVFYFKPLPDPVMNSYEKIILCTKFTGKLRGICNA